FHDDGTEILYFTEEADEFVAQIVHSYQEKEFRSVLSGETDSGEEDQPDEAHQSVLDFVKETLGEDVKTVKASKKLKSHPVCLTAGEGLSFEMEKYFAATGQDMAPKAERHLELNTGHPAFAALEAAVTADPEKAKKYATLLYDQALLIAGMPLEDPSAYTDLVCELMQ
ncbi:MAG: molecular chaperone HtpG, partial [Oscillibacter sp.]